MRFYSAHRDAVWLGFGCLIALAMVGLFLITIGRPIIAFIQFANAPFIETVVDNRSNVAYVAEIDDYHSDQAHTFVPVPANAFTDIDSVGEVNSATEHVWLWDSGCASRAQVSGYYAEGGTITIAIDGSISFAAMRTDRITPTELDTGQPTCLDAAAALVGR
jgi:hypothetical protein